MKKNYSLMLLLASILSYSQIGIKTPTPSSTLDVNGSIEGNYKEIYSTRYNILNTDYHLSFNGYRESTFTLPKESLDDGSNNDFSGRKYFIKNNSATSNLIINPYSKGKSLRLGGASGYVNTITIDPGSFLVITANDNNGWDLDLTRNQPKDNNNNLKDNWNLYYTDSNSFAKPIQQRLSILGDPYQVTNSDITVVVPEEYDNSKVILNYTGWGDATCTMPSTGSIRFTITRTAFGVSTITDYAFMATWSSIFPTGDLSEPNSSAIRWNFPATYVFDNLSPGTYNFKLTATRQNEKDGVTSVKLIGLTALAQVFVK